MHRHSGSTTSTGTVGSGRKARRTWSTLHESAPPGTDYNGGFTAQDGAGVDERIFIPGSRFRPVPAAVLIPFQARLTTSPFGIPPRKLQRGPGPLLEATRIDGSVCRKRITKARAQSFGGFKASDHVYWLAGNRCRLICPDRRCSLPPEPSRLSGPHAPMPWARMRFQARCNDPRFVPFREVALSAFWLPALPDYWISPERKPARRCMQSAYRYRQRLLRPPLKWDRAAG